MTGSSLIQPVSGAENHITICGFSRSGTTLLYQMLRNSVTNYKMSDKELPSHLSMNEHGNTISKRPLDIFDVDRIVANIKNKRIIFLFTIRDPRDILVSKHPKVENVFFVHGDFSYTFWPSRGVRKTTRGGIIDTYDRIKKARESCDTISIKYEDLIEDSDKIQKQLGDLFSFEYKDSFKNFHKYDMKLSIPLNGVREVDRNNKKKWRNHPERIKQQIKKFPEILDILIDMGYEDNKDWVKKL